MLYLEFQYQTNVQEIPMGLASRARVKSQQVHNIMTGVIT